MHRLYVAAIWGSVGVIVVGLSMVFGVWGVGAVAAGVGIAYFLLHIAQRGEPPA